MRMLPVLVLLTVTAPAVADTQEAVLERVDDWGSVLYCRQLYLEPGVSGMIYAGDHRACEQAHERLAGAVQRDFSPAQARAVAQDAARRAAAIRANTRSAQEAVSACRHQCRAHSGESAENSGKAADSD